VIKKSYSKVVTTLLMTGMGTGELIGLKWTDIDFKKKEIKINRTIPIFKFGFQKLWDIKIQE
jgi:integrase